MTHHEAALSGAARPVRPEFSKIFYACLRWKQFQQLLKFSESSGQPADQPGYRRALVDELRQGLRGDPISGASVSPLGTARGQFHFRHVYVSLNMIPVNAPHVDIANAKAKFDLESRLHDQPSLDSLRQLLEVLKKLTYQVTAGEASDDAAAGR